MKTLLLIGAILTASASETAPRTAFLNPQVSAREICLNQTVQIAFVTLKPQVEGVDPSLVIAQALSLPNVQRWWRVVGRPKVEVDDKIKTLKAAFHLLPRSAGLLTLPEIPIKWLAGNTVGRMGDIQVNDQIQMGTERLPPPEEVKGVAGYAWGITLDELLRIAGLTAEAVAADPATGCSVVRPKENLDLLVRDRIFAAARLHAPAMPLATARQSFLERWGDPIGEVATANGTVITWMSGWIRIEAHSCGDGTILYLIHEEIESRLARAAVDRQIFNTLNSGAPPAPVAPKPEPDMPAPARGESPATPIATPPATTPPATTTAPIEVDDFIREFERKVQENRTGGTPSP
jgi:hypothetical protein